MTPQDLLKALQDMTPGQMGAMDHATLYNARRGATPAQQDQLAGYEHRAFAREATADNPLLALPIAAGALAYQPYKMLTGQSRSGASLGQVGQGLQGVGEGLWGAFQKMVESPRPGPQSNAYSPATGLLGSLQRY